MGQDEVLRLIDQAADEGWTELDLAGMGLTELPKEIGKLTQLETLILGKLEKSKWVDDKFVLTLITNGLTDLPSELSNLQNLKTLNLDGNPLKNIPEWIQALPSLESLSAISIGSSQIPDCIGKLTNLTELRLASNQISVIPECIGELTNLATLGLASNQISAIPKRISSLINLTKLDLSSNQISEIPESIDKLTRLTELRLSSNRISEIPESIGRLTKLQRLWFNNNQISEIPKSINNLNNIIEFGLSGNRITAVPEYISELTCLRSLWLSNNQISEIPRSIEKLINLKRFRISGNQISEIPKNIGKLTRLAELKLSSNQVSEIPECISKLTRLTELGLSSNRVSEIPESISKLKHLTKLGLSSNQISEIPESIGSLANLTELGLSSNRISEIPESIGRLTNLTGLWLDSNQITEIPKCIGNLIKLERLDLKNNKIENCPEWLRHLPQLETLDLRRNPLPISPEVLGASQLSDDPGSINDIFNYLDRLHSGEVRPLNEAKLLIVGQGSVGKTSLIKRLIDDTYSPIEPQTDGLRVRTWPVHVNSKDVHLNVWDFGGQEIYHSTHQFFLTKRSVYLLVCNCRTSDDENRIEYWLKLIESFGGDSPVIIVGNKCDEQPPDINCKALREKYSNIKDILETSCQTSDGIGQLRDAILNEIAHLKEVYDLLPLTWFEVKEKLEDMDRDFISYNEYINVCCTQSISKEQDQEQLIDLLHRLGLVLNFRDHPILQSTNVLNPDWVTQGIYSLLSDETLKTKNKGILTYADLSRILNPDRYPADRHKYLIELMKEEKFQLCFQIHDCPVPTFLIPGLLPKEEPEDTNLEGDTLEFQYHYRILPDSIISRFIVLTHEKIHEHIYWRSGVMLAYCEGFETCNIARIKADPADAKIFISISGRETTRRLFLGILRDVFNKIHSSFTNPEITEWVPVPGHPDHPPLDYQELLGLEDMGVQDYPIGKLKLKVNIRQLLDGYESAEARFRQRMKEKGLEMRYEDSHPGTYRGSHQESRLSTTYPHGTPDNPVHIQYTKQGQLESSVKTILVLAANPKGTNPLRLGEEVQALQNGLARSPHRDRFRIEQRWTVTPTEMRRALLDCKPQVVHFSGHGVGIEESDTDTASTRKASLVSNEAIHPEGLMFEDEMGEAKLVSTSAIAQLFSLFADHVECVVLNACYSATQAEAIAQHIPYVVGMKRAVGDRAAIEFAIGFYDAILAEKSVDFAYRLGCAAIQMGGIPEHLTPILKQKNA